VKVGLRPARFQLEGFVADVEATSCLLPLVMQAMAYSIFDSTGNLIEAFADRAAALDFLVEIAQAEPSALGTYS
jgi:hypothetical protein